MKSMEADDTPTEEPIDHRGIQQSEVAVSTGPKSSTHYIATFTFTITERRV